MIKGEEFHDIIGSIFDDVRNLHDNEQIQANCPKCQERDGLAYPDGKFNLEINTNKRVFRCWKCDEPRFSGSLGRLIRTYGSFADYEIYKSFAGIFHDYEYSEDEKEYEIVKLPEEMIFFSQMDIKNPTHFEAYNYIINERKFDRELVLKYRLGFCVDGKHGGRIIIPSYDEFGEVNYFVGRAFKSHLKQKFMNPEADKGKFIFNDWLINWDSTIYLVEGAFEFLSFPVNSIPMLGKDLLEALYEKIKETKPNIVILLDPDAMKTAVNLFHLLTTIYVGEEDKVKIVELPTEDDLDELRKHDGMNTVINAIYGARTLNVDDNFLSALHVPNGFERNRLTLH